MTHEQILVLIERAKKAEAERDRYRAALLSLRRTAIMWAAGPSGDGPLLTIDAALKTAGIDPSEFDE